ncbi:poly(A) polymerase [Alphaproteobacteria bacterium]|nr:poly(A) polymerase [Alphaproteobacteria bacterium]
MTPDFYFLRFQETEILFKIFNKYEINARFVGGCVRDAIFGEKTDDFDIAVNANISKIIDILTKEKVKYVPIGAKYGSILALINNRKFEITSLRKDEKCFGRDCIQSNISSFEEDAKRRDFTINSLYLSQSGELFDYFCGVNDLRKKNIKFIGNPEERIKEDYLRILRYYRFCAKYGDLKNEYSEIIKKISSSIKTLSIERIQNELFKIIESKHAIEILINMKNSHIFSNIFDEFQPNLQSKTMEYLSLEGKLYLLFSFDDLLKTFRLTKQQKLRIKEYKIYENESKEFCFYKKGEEFFRGMEIIKCSKLNEEIDLSILDKKFIKFPIKFQDLRCEIKEAARKIKACEKWWVNNNCEPNAKNCIKYILNLQ